MSEAPAIGGMILIAAGEALPGWLGTITGGYGYFDQRVLVQRLEGSPQFRIARADRECRDRALIYIVADPPGSPLQFTGADLWLDVSVPEI